MDHVLVGGGSLAAVTAVMWPHGWFLVLIVPAEVTVFLEHVPGVNTFKTGAGRRHFLMQAGWLGDQGILQVVLPALRIFIGMVRCLEMQHHAEGLFGIPAFQPLEGLGGIDVR